jgi:ankyrin repeat protein
MGLGYQALYWGDLDAAKQAVAKGVSQRDLDAALLTVCDRGYLDIARLLLDNGANVDCRWEPRDFGYTPLMRALQTHTDIGSKQLKHTRQHRQIVRLLLARGADVRLQDKYGRTAVRHALLKFRLLSLPTLLCYSCLAFFRRRGEPVPAADPCPECGCALQTRSAHDYIRKHAGGNRYMQREFTFTEVYCPACGHVADSNRDFAARQAENETLW